MTLYTACLLLFYFVMVCDGFFFSTLRGEKWNDLKVTWGANPFSSTYFAQMPRTTDDAEKEGFTKISDCDTTAQWRGSQYVKNNDLAVILLYDVNGYIAGIQTTVPGGLDNGYPSVKLQPPFIYNGDLYILSAYFVDPSIICTTGRTTEQFDDEGTGVNLYIQNGTVPESSIMMPKKEEDVAGTKWVEGKCFATMGKHYWYNISDDMSCDTFFPVFLLYNGGQLNAFGWALQANLNSTRYEHPGQDVFGLFMKSPPSCLATAGTLSTMHIYMTGKVLLNVC